MLSESGNLYLVGYETLGQWDGSEWVYYLPDALGSIRQETDGTGGLTDSREWTPFGVEVGTGQAGLGYTGEWWDDSAEFLYLRARWYEPQVGRFSGPDPVIPDFQNPQSINQYAYILGNPVGSVDPSGFGVDWTQPPPPIPAPPPEYMVLIERTVKIRAYPRILSSCIPVGTRKYHGGLGTVIYGGNTILTHNHYGSTAGLSSMQFWRQVDYIEVINYRGESERVDRDRLTLGLQNNPGTLIIRLPPWVNLGVPSAQLGNPDTLSPGESVQVVYEGGGGVLKAMWSGYVGLLANEPEPTAVLDDPSRVLDHGDSGGGLFKDSWWLVGNTWSIGGPGKAVFMSALLPDGI